MNVDTVSIVLGGIFAAITLIWRTIQYKSKIVDKINLILTLGYVIFAYLGGVLVAKMSFLSIVTFNNNLTLELINANKPYVFLAWIVIILGSLISFISLLVEKKTE